MVVRRRQWDPPADRPAPAHGVAAPRYARPPAGLSAADPALVPSPVPLPPPGRSARLDPALVLARHRRLAVAAHLPGPEAAAETRRLVDWLLRAHAGLFRGLARQQLARAAAGRFDAAELESDLWAAYWRAVCAFDPWRGTAFGTVLGVCLRRACVNTYRRVVGRRAALAVASLAELGAVGDVALAREAPCALQADEAAGVVERALAGLADPRAAAAVRRLSLAAEPEDLRAVAADYGVSRERVRQLHVRGRAAVRAALEAAGHADWFAGRDRPPGNSGGRVE